MKKIDAVSIIKIKRRLADAKNYDHIKSLYVDNDDMVNDGYKLLDDLVYGFTDFIESRISIVTASDLKP